MTMMKRLLPVQISTLADDEVEVVMSTGTIARDGHVLVPQGAALDNYRANPVVLWQHDAMMPVARSSDIRVAGNSITAKVTFAPQGVSAKADEVRGLVKSGIINAVSVGFDPIDGTPLDPKRPRGGQRFTTWELLELSFVSVPADTGAVVTARDHERDAMTEQNTAAPAATITEPAEAGDGGTVVAPKKRGMYGVAMLACALDDLGYIAECAAMEAAWEGDDDSEVPGLLLTAVKGAGAALLAMTAEEIAELIACLEGGEEDQQDQPAERYHRAAAEIRQRLTRDDGGEETMAAHVPAAREALAHLQAADEHHRAGRAAHRRAADCMRGMIGPEAPANGNVDPEDPARAAANENTRAEREAAIARLARLAAKGELHARGVTVAA